MIRIISEQKDKDLDTANIVAGLLERNPSLRSLIRHYLGKDMTNKFFPQDGSQNMLLKQTSEEKTILKALSDDLLIKKGDLSTFHNSFKTRYYTAVAAPNTFNDVCIKWPILSADMQGALNPIAAAYKFIHRFNGTNWFLTAQRQELAVYGDIGKATLLKRGNESFFDMHYTGDSYETDPDGIYLATNASGNYYDPEYLDKIKTKDNYLATDRVWSAILPGQELRLLVQHNLFLGGNEQDYEINFKSITYNIPAPKPGEDPRSNVDYPHCIAVYATHNGTPALDDAAVVICADFRGKAGNFDSLCPPSCTKYFWHEDLPA